MKQGGMHNRQGLSVPLLWQAISDFDLWPIYLLGLTILQPVGPIQSYLTLNLRQLGFDTFETNLLTIPGYVLFAIQLLVWTRISEKINNRFLVVFFCSVWLFPLILSLRLLPDHASSWVRYAITVLIIGYPYVHSIIGKHKRIQLYKKTSTNFMFCSIINFTKRWLSSRANGRQRSVQHVRAGRQHHFLKREIHS